MVAHRHVAVVRQQGILAGAATTASRAVSCVRQPDGSIRLPECLRPYFGGAGANELNPDGGAGIYVLDNTNEGYNLNFTAHNSVAYSMVGVFAALLMGIPLLFPQLSRAFNFTTVSVSA
mgnify:CR=1 FL=1